MLDICYLVAYNDAMKDESANTVQVAFRLAPAQITQLNELSTLFGGKSRALSVALEMLYQRKAEVLASLTAQPAADAAEPGAG